MQSITTIYINSKDATTGTGTNFKYRLPQGINDSHSFFVKNVCIPFSSLVTVYPPISGGTVNFIVTTPAGTYVASMMPGNYSAYQAGVNLQSALNIATGDPTNFTVTYNAYNYTYTITNNLAQIFTIQWNTVNQVTGQEVYYTYGFNNVELMGATSYTSPNASTSSGTSYNYYVRSSALTVDGCYSYYQTKKDNIICQVPLNTGPGGLILYEDINPTWLSLRASNLSQIDIQLVDEYNNLVNLQGLDWTITLVIRNKAF
jgi:hypothetical protein